MGTNNILDLISTNQTAIVSLGRDFQEIKKRLKAIEDLTHETKRMVMNNARYEQD